MSNDKDYFLYFLDREFLETQGTYDLSMQNNIKRDVRFSLFSTSADLILSASFLFESKYALSIFREFKSLFYSRKFIIAITYDDLPKMIEKKQELYRGKESVFPNYFNDLWHMLQESNIVFVQKATNTTSFIADRMTSDIYKCYRFDCKDHIPYYKGAIEDRNGQAITHHLFKPVFEKLDVSLSDQSRINTIITESYIKSYLEFFDATIPTGLSCGIFKFDYLSKSYYTSNLSVWMKLYKQIGLYDFICSCNVRLVNDIIESSEHIQFVRVMREWITSQIPINSSLSFEWNSIINTQIPKQNQIPNNDVNGYLKRVRIITELIKEKNERMIYLMQEKERTVFVVYGRNEKVKRSLFQFLRSLNLKPLEWETAARLTKKGAPSTLEIISAGMQNAAGIIVLFTGDEKTILKKELRKTDDSPHYAMQPRPNVLVEAGMALAISPNQTIIVKVGSVRQITDLDGINYVDLSNAAEHRQNLLNRLSTIGLQIDSSGNDWLSAGNFNE